MRRMVASAAILTALLITVLAVPPSRAAGNTYYVATSGSDSNPGSTDRPWRTIQKAATVMVAGDTCLVQAGNYAERVLVARSGSFGAPITYRAEGTVTMRGFTVLANYVTVAGFDISDTADNWREGIGVFVQGSNCVIEGNYIHYCTWGGISLYVTPADGTGTSNCVVRNNRLYKNSQVGIDVNGRNHLVEGNEIWGTIQYHPQMATPPSWVDADGIRFFGTGHTIRRNHIHDIKYGDVGNVNPHIDCFQTWGPAYDIVFEQNVCRNCQAQARNEEGEGFMIEEANAPVRNIIIRNNVVEAIKDINALGCENLTIVNNTFTSDLNVTISYPFGVGLSGSPYAVVKNNVFYDVGGGRIPYVLADSASTSGLDVGYNCIYMSDGRAPAGSPWPSDLWGVNPLLVNPAVNDDHLQSGSPCIDMGLALSAVANDLDGASRPQGSALDIGAYEYLGGVQPTATPSANSTPTPTNTIIPTRSPTATAIRTATQTAVPTPTNTMIPTNLPTATATRTATQTAVPTASRVETTVTFRQGDAGYGGAQDAWISADAPTANYDAQDMLRVGYRQKYASLLRFDLSSIPAGSTVLAATLRVWAAGWSGSNQSIGAYAVLRDATYSQVTWSQASAGNPWGLRGCNDVVTDRRAIAASTVTTAGIRKWYAFDLGSLVQAWVSGGLANDGVLLRQSVSSDRSMLFASAEYSTVTNRPQLVVTYR